MSPGRLAHSGRRCVSLVSERRKAEKSWGTSGSGQLSCVVRRCFSQRLTPEEEMEKTAFKRSGDLPTVTELVSSRVRIRTQNHVSSKSTQ